MPMHSGSHTQLSAMPANSPVVAAVSNDDSCVDFSPHNEMLESEGGVWTDHSNVVDDYVHDCDLIGQNIVEPDPDPSSPISASEGEKHHHCLIPLTHINVAYNVNIPNKNDSDPDMMLVNFDAIPNVLPLLWII